jgi:hypothetical protein
MLGKMSTASNRPSLLDWFADHHPDQTHRAGSLVFIDVALVPTVLDRVQSAGIAIERARGYAVQDGVARGIDDQEIVPDGGSLLDCETPSGATCGAVRRVLTTRWVAAPPGLARHMVVLDLDDQPGR